VSRIVADFARRTLYDGIVMRGLDPRIHPTIFQMMDCRVKPGNDN
jgi:hypothetical protein